MIRNPKTKHDFYKAFPESTLKDIKSSNGKHFVTIQSLRNDECQTFEVSYCAILIGSRPDLSLLHNLNSPSPSKQQIASMITDNVAIRTLRRLKIFCDKCRHLNLCFGIKNRNIIINSLIEDANSKSCAVHKTCQCELTAGERRMKSDDCGVGFGEDPDKPINCKNNPLAVNKFTNELIHVPGIYALGPLVGDNFVRFIAGGALSISSALFNETWKTFREFCFCFSWTETFCCFFIFVICRSRKWFFWKGTAPARCRSSSANENLCSESFADNATRSRSQH